MSTQFSPMDKANQALVANTHPENYVNPNPAPLYSLVVIGAGTAGLISSIVTAGLGGKVALIERDYMGGDCLNTGCVPSKALIRSARLAKEKRMSEEFGFSPTQTAPEEFANVMEKLREIRSEISKNDSVDRYTKANVEVFFGQAKFNSPNSVSVDGKILNFKKAIIATGARAVEPNIEGLKEVGFLSNENVFNLTTLPKRLMIIGGGPIGCELAQAFQRLGSQVTIVANSAFLPREDQDAAEILYKVFQEEGIAFKAHSDVTKVEQGDNCKIVHLKTKEGQIAVEVDEIMVGVGRAPNVENMGLEVANVQFDVRKGIIVNDNLQTSNQNIYAAGDCCMMWKFTHAADAAAQIAIQNAFFLGRKKLSSLTMPWSTYTDPEIAHVGMYEADAKAQNIEVEFFKMDLEENDRAICDREKLGFVKIMVKKGSDKILGATIVSGHAGEMISIISTAMAANMGLGKLGKVIFPYPTQAEIIKRVANQYNKTKLTPQVAKILKWFLRV